MAQVRRRNVPSHSDLDGPLPADRHSALGLGDDDAVEMYRLAALARRIDQRGWVWNRQGKVPFMVSGQGHEGTQVAAGLALRTGVDWVCPYYRDLALMLALGASAEELLTQMLAKGDDPNCGGRQMPNHWGSTERRVISTSSCIATQLPHAVGAALAERFRGGDAVALATFGDGAVAKGDYHEALNWAAIHGLPVVFLCENNGYAISVPEDLESSTPAADHARGYGVPGVAVDGNDPFAVYEAVATATTRARAGHGPSLIEARTYRTVPHTSDDDDRRYRSRDEVEAWKAADPVQRLRNYVVARDLLSADAVDALDGDLDRIVATAAATAEGRTPPDPGDAGQRVWARPTGSHAAAGGGRPRPAPDPRPAEGARMVDGDEVNVVEAVRRTLDDLLASDGRVVVFGEDVGNRGGVFLATDGLRQRHGDRVFDSPLAESSIIGVAIGAAAAGLRPIAEIQFADFLHSGFDQLVSEAARMHYRSNGAWTCPMVVRVPYGAGIHGSLYHSQSVEAFYAHVPGLKVVAPSTPADVAGLLREAVDDPDPVLFLEHKKTYRAVTGGFPPDGHRVPIGRASLVRPGTDLTIVTYGYLRHVAVSAADRLAAEGIDVEILDLRTISPLDRDAIAASVSATGRCMVLTEDSYSFGVAAEVAAWVMEACFYDLDAPVQRLCPPDVPAMPFDSASEAALLPDEDLVVTEARALAHG